MTTQRQRRPVVLLRPVPGTSVIHQLWAGTKIIVVFLISLLLAFYPGWVPIGLMAALVAVVVWLAHIPRGVLPSIPRWLWILLLIGCVLATIGGGEPVLRLLSVDVEVGGLLKFLRFTALSIVLLALGALVSWTTNVADVAPAVATLGRPFRRLRIPVDDWAVTLGLSLRAFPMLLDEFRLLYAARRLRPRAVLPDGRVQKTGAIRIISLFIKHLDAGGGDSMALFERPNFTALRILEENGFGVYQTFNPTILYVHRRRVAATE